MSIEKADWNLIDAQYREYENSADKNFCTLSKCKKCVDKISCSENIKSGNIKFLESVKNNPNN